MASILITGANGGLGSVVTRKLVAEGHDVLAVIGQNGPGLLEPDENIRVAGVDLLDEQASVEFINQSLLEDPSISAAVLLVGGFAMGKLADTGRDDLQHMIDLNFYTAFHLARPLLKHFLSRPEGGRFILVGSRPGLDAAAGKDFFAYSLSKAMVFKLAEFINAEGKGKNVDATVIVPSVIDTEANRKAMPGADFSAWVTPESIAGTIAYYLSAEGMNIREGIVKLYNRS